MLLAAGLARANGKSSSGRPAVESRTYVCFPAFVWPAENVWQFMRDKWLSNRVFKSYDDILDQCCFAWNRLTDQPWRFISLGLRTWAHRF